MTITYLKRGKSGADRAEDDARVRATVGSANSMATARRRRLSLQTGRPLLAACCFRDGLCDAAARGRRCHVVG